LVVDLYSLFIRRSKILQIILILEVSEFIISIIKQMEPKKKIFVRQIASQSCTTRVETSMLIALKYNTVAVTKGVSNSVYGSFQEIAQSVVHHAL
jgi:hypothetical protein